MNLLLILSIFLEFYGIIIFVKVRWKWNNITTDQWKIKKIAPVKENCHNFCADFKQIPNDFANENFCTWIVFLRRFDLYDDGGVTKLEM